LKKNKINKELHTFVPCSSVARFFPAIKKALKDFSFKALFY
jgi:hypothetical protein